MEYAFLLGIVLGKIAQSYADVSTSHTRLSVCALLAGAIGLGFFRSRKRLACLLLVASGAINFIAIPKTRDISLPHAVIEHTNPFGLNSQYALVKTGKSWAMVKGKQLTPGKTGSLAHAFFRDEQASLSGLRQVESNLQIWSHLLEQFISKRIRKLSAKTQAWFEALFLGDITSISDEFRDALKFLGIYHIAIISGLHFNLIGHSLAKVGYIPVNILYGIRAVTPGLHLFLRRLVDFTFLIFLIAYANALSFTQPIQRALILFLIKSLCSIFAGRLPRRKVFAYGLCTQAMIFPLGFFESATFISWGCYVIALAPESRSESLLAQQLVKQCLFTLLTASVFGELSVLAIIINWLFGPFFHGLLTSGIGLILAAHLLPAKLTQITCQYHQFFHDLCLKLYECFKKYPFLYINIKDYVALRLLMGLTVSFCLLIIYKQAPTSKRG